MQENFIKILDILAIRKNLRYDGYNTRVTKCGVIRKYQKILNKKHRKD